MRALAVVLSLVGGDARCLGTADLLQLKKAQVPERPHDWTKYPLFACLNHGTNSCCPANLTEVIAIKTRVHSTPMLIDDHWKRKVSAACQASYERALCAACDAFGGQAALKTEGQAVRAVRKDHKVPLCLTSCEHWFNECATSYVTESSSSGRMQFCHPLSSLACWRLETARLDAETFCTNFGFAVVHPDEEAFCVNFGAPSAASLGRAPLPPTPPFAIVEGAKEMLTFLVKDIGRRWNKLNAYSVWIVLLGAIWILTLKNRRRID